MANDTSSPKLIVPAVAGLYEWGSDMAYPLVRFFAGIMLVPHGMQKLFGMFGFNPEGFNGFLTKFGFVPAELWVIVLGIIEVVGGLMIAFGLLTRPWALAAAIELLVAAFVVHLGNGYFWDKGGYEFPLLWGIVMIAIFLKGGGRLSIDSKLGKEF